MKLTTYEIMIIRNLLIYRENELLLLLEDGEDGEYQEELDAVRSAKDKLNEK